MLVAKAISPISCSLTSKVGYKRASPAESVGDVSAHPCRFTRKSWGLAPHDRTAFWYRNPRALEMRRIFGAQLPWTWLGSCRFQPNPGKTGAEQRRGTEEGGRGRKLGPL